MNLFQSKPVRMEVRRPWPLPQVVLIDKQGRVSGKNGVKVTVRSLTVGMQLAGKTTELTIDGVATFANLTYSGGLTTMKISFSSPGLPDVQVDVNVVADPANVVTSFKIVQGPPTQMIDKQLYPFKLQAINAAGGNVAKAGVQMTPSAIAVAPVTGTIVHAAGLGPTYQSDATGLWSFNVGIDASDV